MLEQIDNQIDTLEQQQWGVFGANPQLDAQIINLYGQRKIISSEQDFGLGFDAYDPDAIENQDDVLPPPPPPPPPPPHTCRFPCVGGCVELEAVRRCVCKSWCIASLQWIQK